MIPTAQSSSTGGLTQAATEKLEVYLRRRGWAPVEVFDRACVFRLGAADPVVMVVQPGAPWAEHYFDQAIERLSQVERRTRGAVLRDMDGDRAPARSEVYFGGGPVADGGIDLQFAASALADYRLLLKAVHGRHRQLGRSGRLPSMGQLLLTGVARGSFGFIVEENDPQFGLAPSRLGEAMNETALLIEKVGGNQTQVEEALVEQPPRVLNSLERFLKSMAKAEASVRIVAPAERASLGVDPVISAARTVGARKASIEERVVEGTLRGLTTQGRTFELQVDNELFSGPVAQEVPAERVDAWARRLPLMGVCRGRIREIASARPGRASSRKVALMDLWRPDEPEPERMMEDDSESD